MKNPITFIKLGGSVITDKETPEVVRYDVLDRLIDEIARARKEKNLTLVLGNGAGSFAHMHAIRYKTMDGFISHESRLGMAITQDSAARLNRIVVAACLKRGIPALTLAPSNMITTAHRQPLSFCVDVLKEYIDQGMVPVSYGDVLVDHERGCTIWSTDTVFGFLAREMLQAGYDVSGIIHVTQTNGVWKTQENVSSTKDHDIYSEITPSMEHEVVANMTDPKGFDVTGGMKHKIEESISLAKLGMDIRILSGESPDTLYRALMGDASMGTLVTNDA